MGKYSRNKGNVIEREIVNMHRDAGIRARRVPLSGAALEDHADILIFGGRAEGGLDAEVKYRRNADGFKRLRELLHDTPHPAPCELVRVRYNDEHGRLQRRVLMKWVRWVGLISGAPTDIQAKTGDYKATHDFKSVRSLGTAHTWLIPEVDLLFLRKNFYRYPDVLMRHDTYATLLKRWKAIRAGGIGFDPMADMGDLSAPKAPAPAPTPEPQEAPAPAPAPEPQEVVGLHPQGDLFGW